MRFGRGPVAEVDVRLRMHRAAVSTVLRFGDTVLPGDNATARALASAGLAGLISLPLLIAASLVLKAPLAGPAVIALGYLACAQAMTQHERSRAALWVIAVFAGLIVWALVMGASARWPALIAALVAPIMAAAPALARYLLSENSRHAAAIADQVACLDRFAPKEAVLFLERTGAVLAATSAASRRLGLLPGAPSREILQRIHILDRPLLAGAFARRRGPQAPTDIDLRLAGTADRPERKIAATVECESTGIAIVRLGDPSFETADPHGNNAGESGPVVPKAAIPLPTAFCDVGAVIHSVLREARREADRRGVVLQPGAVPEIEIGCTFEECRGVLAAAVGCALGSVRRGGSVCIEARRLDHALLVRISLKGDSAPETPVSLRTSIVANGVEGVVDRLGGSSLVEDASAGPRVSIRLPLAHANQSNAAMRELRRRLRCG